MSSTLPIPLRVRIERVQKALGLTASKLAEEIKTTPEWLSKIKRGRAGGSEDIGLRLDDLLRRRGIEPRSVYDEPNSMPLTLQEAAAEYGDPVATLVGKLRADFDELLTVAGTDRDRLGWVRVQLDQMLAFARSWLSPDDVNRRALEKARQMTAAAEEHRRSVEQHARTAGERKSHAS